jgi:hypothetical protein
MFLALNMSLQRKSYLKRRCKGCIVENCNCKKVYISKFVINIKQTVWILINHVNMITDIFGRYLYIYLFSFTHITVKIHLKINISNRLSTEYILNVGSFFINQAKSMVLKLSWLVTL